MCKSICLDGFSLKISLDKVYVFLFDPKHSGLFSMKDELWAFAWGKLISVNIMHLCTVLDI